MDQVLDSTSVVGTADFDGGQVDVCSEAKCVYDVAKQELVVSLESFVRHPNPPLRRQRVKAPWLPERQTVRELVPVDEAGDMARDIASSWRRKIAECIPERAIPRAGEI
ncbi:MAG: hypothetical protein PHC88_11650 [Terrimicrobiaceae bacterium]|nr:hypothetical protein [Terrimicrobiaceae bacterium]